MPAPPGRGRYHLTLSARFIDTYVDRAAEIRQSHPYRAVQLTDFVNRLDSLCRDPHSPRHWRYDLSPSSREVRRAYVLEEVLYDEKTGRPHSWAIVHVRYSVSDDDMNVRLEDLALVPIR